MQYLDRTLLVKAAVIEQGLVAKIGEVFRMHFSGDTAGLVCKGSGGDRIVYSVGTCKVPSGELNLLLKLHRRPDHDFDYIAGLKKGNEGVVTSAREELGAFKAYYDFVAGLQESFGFESDKARAEFLEEAQARVTPPTYNKYFRVPTRFRLDLREWEGTRVSFGDKGALPYANVVVKCDDMHGLLVEGTPPLILPWGAVIEEGSDLGTAKDGRLVDLSEHQCLLVQLNGRSKGGVHPDYLKLIADGAKFFLPENRIDL